MPDLARELALLVMEWWEEHRGDSYARGDYACVVYDEQPAIVTKAVEILGGWEAILKHG